MKTMRKKIISCLLALAMVFSVIKGTGVPVKADPGTESNTVKVNASYSGMKITDTEVSQRIVNTLDAMIKAESFKIVRLVGEESFTYLICIAEALVDMQYDFRLEYDTESKICTVYCNPESEPDAFETTLYSNVEGENIYSAITFCTYVELVFARDTDKINEELDEGAEKAYFSKGIDGTTYTLEDKFCPTENGENPYRIPYGGTFASIDDPKFVCFPEITYNGKRYYSWYLDEVNYASVDPVKVDDSTTFTDLYNVFSVSFDEYAHNYPANTDTENVKWSWGTAENEYKDTSVKITCTDEECTESIFIENSEDFPNSISIDRKDIATTCTTDGKTIYTATAKYVENGTTYTYTSTKTIDGDKATGHQWVFDNANAVWNDDNTTVTIKKTCTDTSHDTEQDGAVEVNVSSSNISNEVIAATKCGEASKTVYTATFDSSVDPAIETPFMITKTVMGDVLQHDWIFDTENAIWEGNDTDGYIKATITKKCKNTVHDGDNNITVSSTKIEKNVEPATEEDNTERTYYTAVFSSENDKDITNEFTVKKVVTKQIMPGCEFNVTSDVVWEKDEQGGYKSVTILKNYINSVTGNIEKTERVKSTKIESSVIAATECEQPLITTYTATFDNTVDPDIKTAFTVSFDVEGEILKHDWEYDTENAVMSQEGQEGQERYLITIKKTCNNKEHTGVNSVPVTSDKVTISTGAAITCGEHTTITYTATFNSTVDSDITDAFDVEIEAEGPIQEHNWSVFSVESDGSFYTAPTKATLNLSCSKCGATTSITASSITLSQSTDSSKTYSYTGTIDEKPYTKDLTFTPNPVTPAPVTPTPSHTTHEYEVKFDWENIAGLMRDKNGEIDVNATNNKNYITVVDGKITFTKENLDYLAKDSRVTAIATCKVGGETVKLTVSLENKLVGNQIQYTAKVTDPNGKEWKAYKSYNIKDGTIKDGPAGTSSVEGGDIVIIGLEETYPFTGSKIKPAITVMDGDVVLAQSTDYTVSYTGKNKIGEINKVEVKGKGNYAGKSATAKFKITDPRDAVDKDKLADKVSKVSVNTKKFTYNGKAQYPSEVTVTLKDKSTIVYKVEEDGSFSTESEKEVGLSFSNNVNKGTATVAAMGSDGKVKKASYTIAAAEIASAEFEISAVDWAVKAATPEIKATIKLGDEDVELVAGQDYKVSFKAKEAGENKGTAKISGKGNFKGKHADVTYTVTTMEITESNIVVKAIAGKKAKDVKVIVNDAFGNALNKKFYTVEIQNAEGTALNKGDALTEEIKVVVKGANAAVTTGEDGVTIDVKPGGDIAKVKGAFKVDKNFFKTYTGEPITLDADDFVSGKINVGTLELGKDFNIVAYKNNIKKGTMTVTVQGDGEYSGTKTFKVKIKAKPLDKVAPEN